tara:strand:+ start:13831 stop:14037 length:207 start_codon:yes stop_codon:yes gene_type:complete
MDAANDHKVEEIMLGHFIDLLEKKDFKRKFLKTLNESIDVPIINEKTEKKVLESIYKILVKTLKELEN